MNLLQFIASLVSSLAWPIVALIIVLFLRRPLLKLIPKLTSFKYGDFEAKFETGLKKVENDLLSLSPIEPERVTIKKVYTTDSAPKFQRGPALPPHVAITEAWRSVEREVRTLAERKQISRISTEPAFRIIRTLANKGYLSPVLFDLLNEMRNLRNFAAHSSDLDGIAVEQAQRYVENAEEVVQQLRALE